ncbi:MAG: glycosyltransferase, partial [Candidatus Brocadiia bacterium]|nr:glycosyltransferase [Candidatus Brocadiia bacterium]
DFELLIIDDGSTDSTPEFLASLSDPRVRLVTNPENLGLVRTLNKGLELARGEFVARIDADDAAAPERLEHQVSFLRAHHDHLVVGCWCFVRAAGRADVLLRYPVEDLAIRWKLLFGCALPHPGVMARTDALRNLGGYDAAFPHNEDYDLWCRLSRRGKLHNLPEPLLVYRKHGGQVSSTKRAIQERDHVRISCREIAGLLNRSSIEADQVLRARAGLMGQVPSLGRVRETMSLLTSLARRFSEVHECPAFVSELLSWVFKEHVKLAPRSLLQGEPGSAAARAWAALELATSGVVRQPLRQLAQAALKLRRPRAESDAPVAGEHIT